MVHKTREQIDIQDEVIATVAPAESAETSDTRPFTAGVPPTHPDPDREQHLDALLERAWPRIKASMYYLRDR